MYARLSDTGSLYRGSSAALTKNPQNRVEAVRVLLEKMGGKLRGRCFSFGEYDFTAVATVPDNVTAAALSIAVSGGGTVKSCLTTPLLTPEEGVAAMKKASGDPLHTAPITNGERMWIRPENACGSERCFLFNHLSFQNQASSVFWPEGPDICSSAFLTRSGEKS
jgi:uncharacterized protein with GYD domain